MTLSESMEAQSMRRAELFLVMLSAVAIPLAFFDGIGSLFKFEGDGFNWPFHYPYDFLSTMDIIIIIVFVIVIIYFGLVYLPILIKRIKCIFKKIKQCLMNNKERNVR